RELIKGPADDAVKDLVWDAQPKKAERISTCSLCHYAEKGTEGKERILPPNVPEAGLEHAKFSHKSHQTMACLECHGCKDGGPSAENSEVHTDVLLPPRENCLKCHASTSTTGGKGVRHECVTCHSFHHGDKPLAGKGAAGRGIKERMTIEKLMSK